MMYGGIDLYSNNSVIAIVDCADRVVAQKRLPNEISKIIGFLARWRDGIAGASSAPIDSPHLRRIRYRVGMMICGSQVVKCTVTVIANADAGCGAGRTNRLESAQGPASSMDLAVTPGSRSTTIRPSARIADHTVSRVDELLPWRWRIHNFGPLHVANASSKA